MTNTINLKKARVYTSMYKLVQPSYDRIVYIFVDNYDTPTSLNFHLGLHEDKAFQQPNTKLWKYFVKAKEVMETDSLFEQIECCIRGYIEDSQKTRRFVVYNEGKEVLNLVDVLAIDLEGYDRAEAYFEATMKVEVQCIEVSEKFQPHLNH